MIERILYNGNGILYDGIGITNGELLYDKSGVIDGELAGGAVTLVDFTNRLTYNEAHHIEELMGGNYVEIKWHDTEYRVLPVLSYIEYDGVRYILLAPYRPETISEGEFGYTVQFQYYGQILSKVPFMLNTTDAKGNQIKEPQWTYTGSASTLMYEFLARINELGEPYGLGDDWTVEVSSDVLPSASCSFDSNDILSALSHAAQQFEVEWHLDFDNHVLTFGHVSFGEEAELECGVNVTDVSDPDKVEHYNSWLVRGGSRNISQQTATGLNVSANTRLTLNPSTYPDGRIYAIDDEIVTPSEFADSGLPMMTQVLNFEDIYPKVDLYVYKARSRVRVLKDDEGKPAIIGYDSDNNPIYKTYSIWYIRLAYALTTPLLGVTPVNTTTDDGVTHYWYDYNLDPDSQILAGHTLSLSYGANEASSTITSPLAGREFELRYHLANQSVSPIGSVGDENYDSGVEIEAGDYEIVYTTENDLIIPTNEIEGLVPNKVATGTSPVLPTLECNKTILFNIVMGTAEVLAAQDELAVKATEEINAQLADKSEYTMQSNPVKWSTDNPGLYIGRKANYTDAGGRTITTRVARLDTDCDLPIKQSITLNNEARRGSISSIKEDIKILLTNGGAVTRNGSIANSQGGMSATQRNTVNFLQGLTTDDYSNGNGNSLRNGGLQQVITNPNIDQFYFPCIRHNEANYGAQTVEVTTSFTYNAGTDGGYIRLPLGAVVNAIGSVSYKTELTITDSDGEEIATHEWDNKENVDTIYDVALKEEDSNVTYIITLSTTISATTESWGCMLRIGDSSNILPIVLNASRIKLISNSDAHGQTIGKYDEFGNPLSLYRATADGIEITRYEDGELASGMRYTNKGMQQYDAEEGIWKQVLIEWTT